MIFSWVCALNCKSEVIMDEILIAKLYSHSRMQWSADLDFEKDRAYDPGDDISINILINCEDPLTELVAKFVSCGHVHLQRQVCPLRLRITTIFWVYQACEMRLNCLLTVANSPTLPTASCIAGASKLLILKSWMNLGSLATSTKKRWSCERIRWKFGNYFYGPEIGILNSMNNWRGLDQKCSVGGLNVS